MRRLTAVIAPRFDVARNTSNVATAATRAIAARPTIGGSDRRGNSTASSTAPNIRLNAVIGHSGDIAEALQSLLDLFLRAGVVEVLHLLLEDVRDELLNRRIAG